MEDHLDLVLMIRDLMNDLGLVVSNLKDLNNTVVQWTCWTWKR